MDMNIERTSVAIVGGGPAGVTTANLLGVLGVATVVFERAGEILDYPRAVGLDDEALRLLQSAGLAETLLRDMISNQPMRMFTADGRSFADILPTTREFGWPRRNIFSQPLSEAAMRKGLERFDHVALRVGHEVTGLEQDDDGVTLTWQTSEGTQGRIRADFVIGADGGRSTVRDKLLQIPLVGTTHAAKWVVIECDDDPLDAASTALHCDPARPYVCARLPYGLRRWEFMLFPGEDDEQMLRPEKVHALLRPHVDDPAKLNIIRARVYTHHSRVAREFRKGRVFLVGDAAHLTPPWIGQGLNAGYRDVGNLTWKVAGVVRGELDTRVLDTYYAERHAHAKAMIDLADQVGAIFSIRNRALAWIRDRLLLAMHMIPPVRDYVLQFRFKPMPRYVDGGLVVAASGPAAAAVGRMMPQPSVETADGRALKLDDACGPWFALVGWKCDPLAQLPEEQRARWARMGARSLMVVRARSGPAPGVLQTCDTGTSVVQDIENVLSFWFEGKRAQVAIVRPDRYVGALTSAVDFARASRTFLDMAQAEPGDGASHAPAVGGNDAQRRAA
ncbi:MAG: bifunctional 3-(3-hydroxy-phenyl)propionate/3-hydroxycinnamic acid hydroxylase [Burkholderiaceae bacterium]